MVTSKKNKEPVQSGISEKEALELKKLKLEVKWNYGWRRLLDKFISPATLAVVLLSFGTIVTFNNWQEQNKKNNLYELERNLLISSFSKSATNSLLNYGDSGLKVLWNFLSSSDSVYLESKMSVIDHLFNIVESDKNLEILTKILCPLLTSESSLKNMQNNKSSVLLFNNLYKNLRAISIEFNKIKENEPIVHLIVNAICEFHKWYLDWQNTQCFQSNFQNEEIKEWNIIPAGYFIDSRGDLRFLDTFYARYKTIRVTQSDSLSVIKLFKKVDPFQNKKYLSDLLKISEILDGRLINGYAPEDNSIKVDFLPSLEFRYFDENKKITSSIQALMQHKVRFGILGVNLENAFFQREYLYIKYYKREDGKSEVIFNQR